MFVCAAVLTVPAKLPVNVVAVIAPDTFTLSNSVCPSTSNAPVTSILAAVKVVPLNVKLALSSRAPLTPAKVTLSSVKSLTVADDITVSPPEKFAPPLASIAPAIVAAADTFT